MAPADSGTSQVSRDETTDPEGVPDAATPGDWPETLPDQVARQTRTLGAWLHRTRAWWVVPAWFAGCMVATILWQFLGRSITWSAFTPLKTLLFSMVGSLIGGLAYASAQLIPLLAAVGPGRLVPRFLVGLLGCLPLTFSWSYQAPWRFFGFAVVQYTLVFAASALLSRRWGVRLRHAGQGRPRAERLSLSTGDLLLLTAALAALLSLVGLIDRWFPTDQSLAAAIASARNPAYFAAWFIWLWLGYVALAPLLWAVFLRQRRSGRFFAIVAAFFAYVVLQWISTWLWRVSNGVTFSTGTTWSVLLYGGMGAVAKLTAIVGLARVLRYAGYRLARRRA